VNHRGSLSELVLVKDNHLAGLGITEAVRRAHARWPGRVVEVSGGITLDTVRSYAEAGADLISTSVITQSAPALDLAFDLHPGVAHTEEG
jgi:nicotinate-nucleotide pyrophosphorylase (carboxylating)